MKPNLLYIVTDHQRADSIHMRQAGREVTPNLNRLAAEGTHFTRAYNTCPLCVPARTALATGKYPTKNGVVFNDTKGLRAGDHTPIHQMLHEGGYAVGHIGVHHIRIRPDLRERVPFARWLGSPEYKEYLRERGLETATPPEMRRDVEELQDGEYVHRRYSSPWTATWPHPAEHFQDMYWCRAAADFLRERRDQPFALFLYLWAPHPPLQAPEPFASLFPPEEIDLPENVGRTAEGEPPGRRRGVPAQLAEGLTTDEWRRTWSTHLGLTNLADTAIGEVLSALDETGARDNTVTLFLSDHGDHLGQHTMYQKMEMYEEAVRVPMIFQVPGQTAQQVDTPVSHLDVVPTLAELLDLPEPADLDGVSLADILRGGAHPDDRAVFSQYSGNPTIGDIRRAVITKRYKYIYDPNDIPELFDLQIDPREMRNVAADPEYAAARITLHETARQWAEDHGDWVRF